ncbi:MAG: ROK family protein [Planctomycetes bacterium]|nr:ROK family protein [Planctomycetota bacterium]
MSAESGGLLFGIDVGGTKIGVCLGDTTGRVLASAARPTGREAEPAPTLEWVLEQLETFRRQHASGRPIAAAGAACPGPLSYAKGAFLDPPNMPRWHHFPIREFLSKRLGMAVTIMNDANASALAEWLWGAARGADTAVYLTMSTGMGAGLIVNGRLFEGPLGLAGEIGHIRLRDDGPVGFAKRGSVEGYLSGPGVVQVARAELLACEQAGESTALAEFVRDCGGLTSEHVCKAARAGDPAAGRVMQRCATELGRLLAILTDVLNPDVFVLGTIGSAHFDLWEPIARQTLDAEAISTAARHVQVRPTGLSDRSNQSALAAAWYSIRSDS